jgi:shikimate dehydrogenase
MPYLDEVSELASLTESVNTIYWEDGKLKGTTTDGYGALKNLEHHNVDFQNKKIALLGNGGSARAIAFQLATDAPDSKLTIVSRKRERGSMLSDQVNNFKDGYSNCITFDAYGEISKEFDLIINTTPIGLEPNIDESPLGSDQIHPHQTVYDIVYIPLKTKLLKDAENKGAKIVTGIGMLIFVADFFESIEKIDS